MSSENVSANTNGESVNHGDNRVSILGAVKNYWFGARPDSTATLRTLTVPAPVVSVTPIVPAPVEASDELRQDEATVAPAEDVDPMFEEPDTLAPIFKLNGEHSYQSLLNFEPTYNLFQLASAVGHVLSVDPSKVLVCDARSQRNIMSIPNDRFGSGVDLANVAYAVYLEEQIPWEFKSSVNMATRQQSINRDQVLRGERDHPYEMVLEAVSNTSVGEIGVISLNDFMDFDSGTLRVEYMTEWLTTQTGDKFLVEDVDESALPEMYDVARGTGKQLLYQPRYAYLVNRNLNKFSFLSKYTGAVIPGATPEVPVLAIGTAGKKESLLAPGPEDVEALVRAVAALENIGSKITNANLRKLRDGYRSPMMSSGAAARHSEEPAPSVKVSEIALGNNAPCANDFEALKQSIMAGYAGCKAVAERMLPPEKSCFGNMRNTHNKISSAYRNEITQVYATDMSVIHKYVALVEIFAKDRVLGVPRCPKPAQAAVYHMLNTWAHSGCNPASKGDGSLDYSWYGA